ncbi:MAG: class I SAM-dependent methyltransferase [Pseudomonadota bacterium]|nr:class I SAM-dependent methyltransferase [Pseudomonadota bacterium]
MNIHRPVCDIIVRALDSIFKDGMYADKVVSFQLKTNKKLGGRDRRFVAESVYEIVRWWRLFLFLLDHDLNSSGINYWHVLGMYLTRENIDLPQWREFQGIKKTSWPQEKIKNFPFKIRESIPDWLDEMGRVELGDRWESCLTILNKQSSVILRANRLKITAKELCARLLNEEEIETRELAADALELINRKNLFTSNAFQTGLFEIQDYSSQLVGPFLEPKKGERIIDACAGAGGKSLHMAALMQNKGKIISLDVHSSRLEDLRKRASRAGVDIIEARVIDSGKVIKRLEGVADGLLLDVPCSGLGVLRRKPDTKWKLTKEKVEGLINLQKELLRDYSLMVKPGGRLVYATCSILPRENKKNISAFLKDFPHFSLEKELSLMPDESGYDGFYMARLRNSRC